MRLIGRALCLVLLAAPVRSAELEVSTRVEPEVVRIGQPFSVVVDVLHESGQSPRFEAFQASDLWWEEAPRRTVTLELRDQPGRSLTQLRYSLVGIESGEQTLELPSGSIDGLEAVKRVEVPAVHLTIQGELAEGEDAPRDLAGFPEAPEARPSAMTLAAFGAGVVALAAALLATVYLVRRALRGASSPRPHVRSAVEELMAFDSREESRAREAFALASRAVREAIDRDLGEALPGLTDEEWIDRRASEEPIAGHRIARACELLRSAERVKYGMEQPTRWAVDEVLGEAREVVSTQQLEGGAS